MAQATKVLGRDDHGAEFELDDGSSTYLLGPAAHELADEITAMTPPAPPAVAAPAPEQLAENDKAAQVDQVFAQYQDKPAPFVGGVPDAAGGAYTEGAPASIPAGAPNQSLPPGVSEPNMSPAVKIREGTTETTHIRPENEWPTKWVGGTPTITPQQLANKAASGVAIPKSQTTEVTGAIPASPEITSAQADLFDREELFQKSLAEHTLARLDEKTAQAQKNAADLKNQAAIQEAVVEGAKFKANAMVDYLHEYDAKLAAQRPDPSRFFAKRGGTWGALAAAVSMGLGAYSAALTGGRNQVADMIENGINREVEAERDEYLRDKDARNNLVAELASTTHDVDAAVEAAKAIKLRIVENYGAELAAADGRTETMANWQKFQLDLQQKRIDYAKNLWEKSFGNTMTRTSAEMAFPQRGSPGYRRPLTAEEMKREQIKQNKLDTELAQSENDRKFEQGGGKHGEDAAKATAEANDPELEVAGWGRARSKKEAAAIRKEIAEADTQKAQIDSLTQAGEDPWSAIGFSVPGWVPGIGGADFGSTEYKETKARERTSATQTARGYGGPITDSDREGAAQVTPDPTRVFGGSVQERAKAAKDLIDAQTRHRIRQIVVGGGKGGPKKLEVETEGDE